MTNKPVNANDEDIVDGMVDAGKPLTHPTSMSYSLQRIRLGELCREITDSAPFGISDPGIPDYEHTKQIDSKICDFAKSLPSFFSLSYNSTELPKADSWKSTGLIAQRYIINFLLHAQRCRLHLPYLSRAFKDPAYNYSRIACLEAARMVIRTERQISLETIPFVLARLKFSGMLHCICVAIIVLLIDFCGSNSQQEEEKVDRAELLQAFRILEDAKGQSPFAERLLESFKMVLRRHNASGSAVDHNTTRSSDQGSSHSAGIVGGSNTPTNMVGWAGTNTDNFPMDPTQPGLDDLWQVFDNNMDSAMVDWNTFFAELDPSFLSTPCMK
ncbi:hypothetical protein N7457_009005 [Penicillium paradoxum]|uniref:uncharacterized protein n=1 Tax=Penicillium paradoxum TaxID=176176 RepID=UPI002546CF49|nr:uncharacterized protein N7457_009005 [Penicillium paradoxum]KAJ5774109.1 hypothetical protein N7457_009005 [Penicillium paradoxum]